MLLTKRTVQRAQLWPSSLPLLRPRWTQPRLMCCTAVQGTYLQLEAKPRFRTRAHLLRSHHPVPTPVQPLRQRLRVRPGPRRSPKQWRLPAHWRPDPERSVYEGTPSPATLTRHRARPRQALPGCDPRFDPCGTFRVHLSMYTRIASPILRRTELTLSASPIGLSTSSSSTLRVSRSNGLLEVV